MTRSIAQIIEEQVGRWRIDHEKRRRNVAEEPFEPATVIAISREAGTRGSEVAEKLGALLGIPVYDRQIVEHIARSAMVQVQTVETLDERAQNRIDDYMSALFRERNFDQSDYLKSLTRTVTALWGHGPCVMLGRGAGHIVSRRYCLSVRFVAPFERRVRNMARLEHLTEAQATRLVQRRDAERESFVRRFFGRSIADPINYDLVLNLAAFETQDAAAIVAEAFRRKFASRTS